MNRCYEIILYGGFILQNTVKVKLNIIVLQ